MLVCAVIVAAGCWFGARVLAQNAGLDGMKRMVRSRFPGVAQLSTEELASWLADPKRGKPVLLDVRSEEEFATSHLPGAIRVEPSAAAEQVLPRLPAGRAVVAYCSVGYRSSAMAQRLKKAGVVSVYNLEGSIFQWANEGRPLEAAGRPASRVHPYNGLFGKMLDEKRRARP
jgi:rhodanese-related sulfurtransferase